MLGVHATTDRVLLLGSKSDGSSESGRWRCSGSTWLILDLAVTVDGRFASCTSGCFESECVVELAGDR